MRKIEWGELNHRNIKLFFRYQVAKSGFTYTQNRYGMILSFREEVEVLESLPAVTAQTLITRIGGILGVGRTLTWILNKFCFEYFLFAHNWIIQYSDNEK